MLFVVDSFATVIAKIALVEGGGLGVVSWNSQLLLWS